MDQTCVSCTSCIGRLIIYHCITWEAQVKYGWPLTQYDLYVLIRRGKRQREENTTWGRDTQTQREDGFMLSQAKQRLGLSEAGRSKEGSSLRGLEFGLPCQHLDFELLASRTVRVGLWRKLSTEELMLLNCGVGEDSWESLGLQGDPTSPFWRRSALGFLWKEWC